MLKQIAYASRQSYILNDTDIMELLANCRRNNSLYQITGMLVFFDGTFVQYLEGPEKNIDALYKKISNDKRHRDIVLLIEDYIENREFADWSMAFKNVTAANIKDIEGLKDFKKEDLFKGKNPENEHPGILLLKSFVNSLHL